MGKAEYSRCWLGRGCRLYGEVRSVQLRIRGTSGTLRGKRMVALGKVQSSGSPNYFVHVSSEKQCSLPILRAQYGRPITWGAVERTKTRTYRTKADRGQLTGSSVLSFSHGAMSVVSSSSDDGPASLVSGVSSSGPVNMDGTSSVSSVVYAMMGREKGVLSGPAASSKAYPRRRSCRNAGGGAHEMNGGQGG